MYRCILHRSMSTEERRPKGEKKRRSASCEHVDSTFEQRRHQILFGRPDKSPKGSVDTPVLPIFELLSEETTDYITTSSCSGRIAIVGFYPDGEKEEGKKGGNWLFVTHDEDFEGREEPLCKEIWTKIESSEAELERIQWRYEPVVIHVQCRTLDAAQKLLQTVLGCGFRESGIVVGKRRYMVGIRTASIILSVPLRTQHTRIVEGADRLQLLLEETKKCIQRNQILRTRLLESMKRDLS